MSDSRRNPEAHVRAAVLEEIPDVARVLTRAFVNDPAMNWYGCVPELVKDLDNPTPPEQKTIRNLNWFQTTLTKATFLVGGYIDVVVVPTPAAEGQDRNLKEEIVAAALWLPPGVTLDLPPMALIRAGLFNVIRGWGFIGLKRLLWDFTPAIEGALAKSFEFRGLDRMDSWYLFEMVVDPVYQGKGYATMLMKAGFRRTTPKPVHLEATKAPTRDIYGHFGFEVDEVHQFGVGAVDNKGVRARGEGATGYPEWVMTKWVT